MSHDELISTRDAMMQPIPDITPQQREAATRFVKAHAGGDSEMFLQMLGLLDYDTSQRTFAACGCPQTPENITPGDRGSVRCRLHKNRGRAARTYPRNKAGRE